jgi:hypothetical protein
MDFKKIRKKIIGIMSMAPVRVEITPKALNVIAASKNVI